MPNVLFTVAMLLLRQFEANVIRVVKVKSLKIYLQAIEGVRKSLVLFAVLISLLMVMAVALVLVPIVLFALTDAVDLNTKLICIGIYGGVCLLLPGVFIARLLSPSFWMKVSGGEQMLHDLTNKDS